MNKWYYYHFLKIPSKNPQFKKNWISYSALPHQIKWKIIFWKLQHFSWHFAKAKYFGPTHQLEILTGTLTYIIYWWSSTFYYYSLSISFTKCLRLGLIADPVIQGTRRLEFEDDLSPWISWEVLWDWLNVCTNPCVTPVQVKLVWPWMRCSITPINFIS